MARSPKATPSSCPSEMVVRAMRRAGAWQLRARLRRAPPPRSVRARYTAACMQGGTMAIFTKRRATTFRLQKRGPVLHEGPPPMSGQSA